MMRRFIGCENIFGSDTRYYISLHMFKCVIRPTVYVAINYNLYYKLRIHMSSNKAHLQHLAKSTDIILMKKTKMDRSPSALKENYCQCFNVRIRFLVFYSGLFFLTVSQHLYG